MAKAIGAIGTQANRYKPPKRTKSQRTKPGNRKPRKPYRGQGKP